MFFIYWIKWYKIVELNIFGVFLFFWFLKGNKVNRESIFLIYIFREELWILLENVYNLERDIMVLSKMDSFCSCLCLVLEEEVVLGWNLFLIRYFEF